MDLPLYLQISERLTRDIAAGTYRDGTRLPPEMELARAFGVSVGTLRKALAELTARGLLIRRHGSGNYVRNAAGPTGIYAFFHLELRDGAGMPTARTLSADRVATPAGDDVPWAEAWRIRRLRLLNDTPAAFEEIWIDAAHADNDGRGVFAGFALPPLRQRLRPANRPRRGPDHRRYLPGLGPVRLAHGAAKHPAAWSCVGPKASKDALSNCPAPGSTARSWPTSRAGTRRRHDLPPSLRRSRLRHDGSGAPDEHRAASGQRGRRHP